MHYLHSISLRTCGGLIRPSFGHAIQLLGHNGFEVSPEKKSFC